MMESDNESAELEAVWSDYGALVRRGERKPALDRLGVIAETLVQSSAALQNVWMQRIMGGDPELLKYPLFERWLFTRLKAGVLESRPQHARWLAECERLMTPALILQLPEEARGAGQLLELALQHDPADDKALRLWIQVTVRSMETSLHEVPSGVLWDSVRGATAEECDLRMEELETFERRLPEDLRERYADLVIKARFYYAAYKAHLTTPSGESFAERLASGTWGPVP